MNSEKPVASKQSSAASTRSEKIGAIILAAGPSSRMGQPKQLLELDGKPLLVRTVEAALAAPVWPVIVVLGAHAEKIRPALGRLPVITVENAAWAEGMAASIRTGIATLQQFSRAIDATLIALCDQPAFNVSVIERLIASRRSTHRPIIAARYAGRRGAPAVFDRSHFAKLGALTGEEGARTLLNGDDTQVAAVDLPELAFDLDTPADYTTARHSYPAS